MTHQTQALVSADICGFLDWLPGITLHPYLGSAGFQPEAPHLEPQMPMIWPLGWILGRNKFADTVRHLGWSTVQGGHDIGPGIPHFPFPPDNALLVVIALRSSRTVNFSNSKVKNEGAEMAAGRHVQWPPMPMTMCSAVEVPVSGCGSAWLTNSVVHGLTTEDLLWTYLALAVKLATSVRSFFKGGGDPVESAEQYGRDQLKEDLIGSGPSSHPTLMGLLRLGYEVALGHGNADVPIQLTTGFFQTNIHVRRDGTTGEYSAALENQIGTDRVHVQSQWGASGLGGNDGWSPGVSAGMDAYGEQIGGQWQSPQGGQNPPQGGQTPDANSLPEL